MKNKNNNLVMEMIDQLDVDDSTKGAMKRIFESEIIHSNSSSNKTKVNNCREVIERVTK